MNPERWQRVQLLFDEALELGPDERSAYLEAECADDPALRREVESMLVNFAAAGSTFMESPAARLGDDLELPEGPSSDGQLNPGDHIGPYVLERLLGSGGVGRVYLANRETAFQKLVAVKLLKRGMDTDELVRRFISERQILAQLEHPNVAKLLDGGATEDGRHYLVMEYVDGAPIDRHCSENDLNVRQRVELMLKVCDAVHFAHRNLVVHRDLKPSNILVGQDGEPKLLDFGIAKLLRPEAFPQTVLPTEPGWRAMTPEYASPEQVQGGLITTASDVYSLAVVLYQLLTGRRPYRLESRSLIDVERAVCTTPPMRPSRAVTRQVDGEEPASTGTYYGVDRKKLKQRLSGDLDNILLMALEKEPERRYQSVDQLAADLRRHLDDLPVLARKDSLLYRSSKFIRRHKLPLAAASLVSLMLLAFVVTLVVQQGQILRQVDRAESMSAFLEGLFEISDPSRELGETILARSLLDKGALDIESRLRDQPGLQGDFLGTMGRSYTNLGLLSEAEDMLLRSLELRRQSYGEKDSSIAEAKLHLADVFIGNGDYDRAEPMARQALELHLDLFGEHHRGVVESRIALAALHQRVGEMAKSGQLFAQAEAGARELEDEDLLMIILSRRGHHELFVGNDLVARGLLEEALTLARQLYGETHPEVALILVQLGELEMQHDFEQATKLFEEAIAIQRRIFRDPHPDLALSLNSFALLKKLRGDYSQAEELFEEVIAIQSQIYPKSSIVIASTLNNLAGLERDQGDLERAETLFLEALEIHRRVVGERHPETARVLNNLAGLLKQTGRVDEAEEHYQTSFDIMREVYGEDHLTVAHGYNNLGQVAAKRENYAKARELQQRAAEIIRDISPDHWELAKILINLGYANERLGNREVAVELYLEGLAISRKAQGEHSLTEGQLLTNLTATSFRLGNLEEAEAWGRETLALFEVTQEAGSAGRLHSRRILAVMLRDRGRYEEAEALLLENIKVCREKFAPDLAPCKIQFRSTRRLYELWERPEQMAQMDAVLEGL